MLGMLLELLFVFKFSALTIVLILRLVGAPFPVHAVLKITFVWTLVVYAALRAYDALPSFRRQAPDAMHLEEEAGDPKS